MRLGTRSNSQARHRDITEDEDGEESVRRVLTLLHSIGANTSLTHPDQLEFGITSMISYRSKAGEKIERRSNLRGDLV
jgi:hypothetical protein